MTALGKRVSLEEAKNNYLSQWFHCRSKKIIAIQGTLRCECGATFSWKETLGFTVQKAVKAKWLKGNKRGN